MDKHLYAVLIGLLFLIFTVGMKQCMGMLVKHREPLFDTLAWFGVDLSSMAFAILLGGLPELDPSVVDVRRLGAVIAYCACSFMITCVAYAVQKSFTKTRNASFVAVVVRSYLPVSVAWFFGFSPFAMVLPLIIA